MFKKYTSDSNDDRKITENYFDDTATEETMDDDFSADETPEKFGSDGTDNYFDDDFDDFQPEQEDDSDQEEQSEQQEYSQDYAYSDQEESPEQQDYSEAFDYSDQAEFADQDGYSSVENDSERQDDDFTGSVSDEAASDSGEQKVSAVRWMVALIAILFGIGVLTVIKYKNSTFEEPAADDISSYVTPTEISSDTSSEQEAVSSEEPVYKELKYKESGEEVKKMQQRLCDLGFYDSKSVTGYYGDYTVKSLKVFQKAAGLKQTGKADSATLARLYADDAPKA